MNDRTIRFDDGAAYERAMGTWSRLVGEVFLDWLAPAPGLRWADIGCGNGAFTELIAARCAPQAIEGVDPSEGQLAYARTRVTSAGVGFRQGDAMALPFDGAAFDIAAMALVIFFVPDPAKGVAEMARIVRPGGTVAAYAWDMPGGGFPHEATFAAMRTMGMQPPQPPRAEVSRLDALRGLWTSAGLDGVEVREIPATRTFDCFEDFWNASLSSAAGQIVSKLPAAEAAEIRRRVCASLAPSETAPFTVTARANAIRGRVPG